MYDFKVAIGIIVIIFLACFLLDGARKDER